MSNRNIIFTSPCVAELIDKAMPALKEYEVLVKIAVSTVSSGTERANLIGDPNTSVKRSGKVVFPRQCGYSSSGTVVAIGEKVTRVSVGDRVSCSWSKHAEYCKLSEEKVYKISENIGFDEAAIAHIATFPLAAIRKCRLEIGESAIVFGLGILGLIGIQLLKCAGAVPIIAVDPVAEKRSKALALGADYALDPFEEDFVERVKAITGKGVNVAIEVTGNGKGLDMALDCMARFGRVALLGCTRSSDFSIDYYHKVHGPGITLIGAHTMARPKNESFEGWWCEADDEKTVLKLIESGRIDVMSLIEETYSPEDAPEVYARLAKDSHFPIVQFDWSRLECEE